MRMTKLSLLLLLVVLSIFFCSVEAGRLSKKLSGQVAPPETAAALLPPGSPGVPSQGPAKWALLVGINKYKANNISELGGSLNDVEEMRQVLIGKFEFPPENILVLKDSQATHAAVINAIQTHLIAKAQPGDIVVFDYSGHGSQCKDVTGKMISGLDETIVPWDSRQSNIFDISGAELHPLLLQLAKKTKNVTFILDSCHSGTLPRGARVRWTAADTRTPPPLPDYTAAATREVGAVNEETSPKFASIAAATSRESAFEHFAENTDHGALTYFLARQLRSAKAGATWRDVMDGVSGNVTANYPSQHVSLEGAEADQYVFGDGTSLARTYVAASPSLITPHRVTLSMGQVQGATVGSTYEIYAPGSKKFAPPEKPVAKVQIDTVSAFASEAKFISGSSIAPASRCVEREHQFGKLRMRIFLDGVEDSKTLQSIRTELADLKNIEIADRLSNKGLSNSNMQLRETGGKIQTLGADSTTLSPPVPVSDPDVVGRVVGQIMQWAKWFNTLSIHNPQSDIAVEFTIAGSQTRDPMAKVGKPDMGVWAGESIDATVTNKADRDVYIAFLDLSSDGSIALVYPTEQGANEVLKPGLKFTKTFTTFVPRGRSIVTDVLKVFASYKPLDLRPLTQEMIRGVDVPDIQPEESDPLQGMINDASGRSRGIQPVLTKPVDLGSWTSVQRVLVVKKK